MENEEKKWTNEGYEEVYYDWKYKAIVRIQEDGYYTNPRVDWDNVWRLVIREHRNYTFPNELNFSWDDYDNDYEDIYWGEPKENEFKKLQEDYYIFWIDMYEHSWIVFSMLWEGMNCRFDTSRGIGFFAIPKVYNGYDNEEIHKTKYKLEEGNKYMPIEVTPEEAEDIARGELKDWNQYCSWEVYEYSVYKKTKWTSEDGEEKISWDYFEGCSGYFDKEQAMEDAEWVIEYENKKQ